MTQTNTADSQRVMTKSSITRRHFIQLAGLGSLGLLAGRTGFRRLSLAQAADNTAHDVEINLTAAPAQQTILSGQATTVWKYTASLVKGDASNLVTLPDTYLGPIIHLRTGQRVRINFTNNIAEESIVHWHGLHVPHEADGHPSAVIDSGETYVYEFDVLDRAGTYWYHPHPHGRTGPQAYMGLAGLFVISDDNEDAAELPTGNYDLPLVIQDRTFDAGNQLIYFASPMGFLGDKIFVNGKPNAGRTVENVPHRLRILNGSNSRIYKLAWADDTPLTVIATDGGLLDTAVSRNYVTLSPGERVELWVDFSHWAVGSLVELRSLAFSGGHFGGGGGTLPNGAEFPVMTFQIGGSDATPTPTSTPNPSLTPEAYLPMVLKQQQNSGVVQSASVSQEVTRSFSLYMRQGVWTINGRTFEMTAVASDEIVGQGLEQFRVGWRIAGANIVDRFDQPDTEQVTPQAIDIATSKVGIVGIRHPGRQLFSPGNVFTALKIDLKRAFPG